jgi:hypothetical protein
MKELSRKKGICGYPDSIIKQFKVRKQGHGLLFITMDGYEDNVEWFIEQLEKLGCKIT